MPIPIFPVSRQARRTRPAWIAAVLLGSLSVLPRIGNADVEVVTPDGETVILRDDHTWDFLDREPGAAADPLDTIGQAATAAAVPVATPAVLELTAKKPLPQGCRFGFTLSNRLPDRIKSIVPQFLAYNADDVMFQRKFQVFSDLRPTMQQYREVQFDGISCEDIAYLHVTGAGRCEIGELSKFSSNSAQCLAHIEIRDNPLLPVSKVLPND